MSEIEKIEICDVCKYKEKECHCLKCPEPKCTKFAIYCEHGYYKDVKIHVNKTELFGVPAVWLKTNGLREVF